MIDGHTQLVGLIGWPVDHSLSPVMHNAAFDALGLNWTYLPLPVPTAQINAAISGLVALGFRGANVTVPHKQSVIPALSSVGPDARMLGAVNTIVVMPSDGATARIEGYNTDAEGFVEALHQRGFDTGAGGTAVVVGAGGAARAVVYGLIRDGIGEVLILNRTPEKARILASDLTASLPSLQPLGSERVNVHALLLTPEILVESASIARLLVNATTVGMWPNVDVSIWPDGVPIPSHLTVFDLVYNPFETRFLKQCRLSGARAMDGLGMLVEQGSRSFEMWTGEPAPVEIMRIACERALKEMQFGRLETSRRAVKM